MLNVQNKSLLRSLLLTITLLLSGTAVAENTWVQGGHAGGWVNPDEPLHGMFVEVILDGNSPTGLSIIVAWYAFIDGQQTWIIGIGPVMQDGQEQNAKLSAFIYEGNDFPPLYNPALTTEIPWGEMTIEFDGCDLAHFTWDSDIPGFGSGQMDLERLTTIADSFCNPDLGTDGVEGDDHGNFWQTATAFNLKKFTVSQDQIAGVIDYNNDVDVFIFEVYEKSDIIVQTSGETNTNGELFQLNGNIESSQVSDEESGEGENFRIETTLEPGIYTVHVKATQLDSQDTGQYLIKIVVTQT